MANLLRKCSVLLAFSRCAVDSVELRTREMSQDEVMASMTTEKAIALLENSTKQNVELMQIVHQVRDGGSSGTDSGGDAEEKGRLLLNGMMEEAQLKKELEAVRCNFFEIRQLAILRDLEQDIAYVNAEASAARSEILRASEVIEVITDVKLPGIRTQISEHTEQCDLQRGAIIQELEIVKADIIVMKRILSLLCKEETGGQTLQFLQSQRKSGAGSIVKCGACGTRPSAVWIRHSAAWKPLLASLQSKIASHLLQEGLLNEMDDVSSNGMAQTVVLTQTEITHQALPGVEMEGFGDHYVAPQAASCNEKLSGYNGSDYRGCQTKTQNGKTCQVWDEQYPHMHFEYSESMPTSGLGMHNYCRNPMATKGSIWCYTTDVDTPWEFCAPKEQLEEPTGITKHDCNDANACKIGPTNCDKLRDRFLVILAGMIDSRNDLSTRLDETNRDCADVLKIYRHTEEALSATLKEEQTSLATAQSYLSENMQQSVLSNRQHKELSAEYTSEMTECCANKNKFTGEICSLRKIRGEIYKMAGLSVLITDCEITPWNEEECSRTCEGGHQTRYRSIIMAANKGTRCPPLRMVQECNRHGCPVDCKVDEWSSWSECTALCDGGVTTRTRSKTQEPDNEGEPCPDQSETRECNVGACNVDCVLGDWSEWGLCSKACDGGWSTRSKPVQIPEVGQGECIHAEDPERLQFQKCNQFSCSRMLSPDSNRSLVKCKAMIDLVIMLDGSGSLGDYGWSIFKRLAESLVGAIEGNESGVNLAFMLFSGPTNAEDLENCTSGTPDSQPNMETQCGIKWIHHFSTDIADVSQAVSDMAYPAGTTLTSTALANAQAELINGRPDVGSTVIVITDGQPMSPIKTGQASDALKENARLIFMPVGRAAALAVDDMKVWASKPWEDNVLPITNLAELNTESTRNNILATMCPVIG